LPAAEVVPELWVLDGIDDTAPPDVTTGPANSSVLKPALQQAAAADTRHTVDPGSPRDGGPTPHRSWK
jgi:hypothetical protein